MDYRQALAYIYSFTDLEKWSPQAYSARNFDLRRMEAVLGLLGNPHLTGRVVHIAGTKGKGSTAAMIASVLATAGYRTGLYTSPHLHTLRERIRVNERIIEEEELCRLVEEARPSIDEVNLEGRYGSLTTFEVLTSLAFLYFGGQGVDFQVLEVGLGGRLDATNVARGEVCVITSLSLDHTEVLGESLPQIAGEKAGIIKAGSTLIASPQEAGAMAVLREMAKEKGAPLVEVGRDVTWEKQGSDSRGQALGVKGRLGSYRFSIPLLGEFQLVNAATAVAALEALIERGVSLPPEALKEGMARANWPGRMQVLREHPLLVIDSAHNPASAKALASSLGSYLDFSRLLLIIIGVSADKDLAGIAAELAAVADEVIATRSRQPRAATPAQVAAEFQRLGLPVRVAKNIPEALKVAFSLAREGDAILATGSVFVAAEVIEAIDGISPELP